MGPGATLMPRRSASSCSLSASTLAGIWTQRMAPPSGRVIRVPSGKLVLTTLRTCSICFASSRRSERR